MQVSPANCISIV